MKKSRYSPEQVAFCLRQAEKGTPVVEVCRKMGISEQTFSDAAARPHRPTHQEDPDRGWRQRLAFPESHFPG